MRAILTILSVGALACAGSAGSTTSGASTRAVSAVPVAVDRGPVVETDAQRRERLNARLAEMIRSGDGVRLVEPSRASSPTRRNRPAASSRPEARKPDRPAAAGVATTVETGSETSTIAPPVAVAPARRAGRGYVAPRLDLVSTPRIPTSDIECLTQAIYYEARNESEEGQAAVAEVVLNRSRAGNYPRNVCQVVYQRNSRTCQFTFTCDGSIGRGPVNMTAWGRAERIARDVYEGRSQALLPRASVNYHANYVRPSWGRRLEKVRQIGAHIFYGRALNGTTPGAEAATPSPPSSGGLQFVRIEALDRAYAALTDQTTAPASE